MTKLLARGVLIAGVVLLLGCDDTETIQTQNETVVHVVDAQTGAPVAGVKVALMAGTRNTPLADPVRSGDDGTCVFQVVPGGDSEVLAFGGAQWRQYGATGSGWSGLGDGVLAPLTPPAYPEPVVRVLAIPTPGGVNIGGTAVDAGSGEPLAAVFLSTTPYPAGYDGNVGASDDVTLADGAFTVYGIRFIRDPQTGRMTQVPPLWVTRHGYRPRLWSYEAPAGTIVGNVTGVRIELQRDEGGERGSLRGRLVRGGDPVPWVMVGLGWAELPTGAKAGPGMTGWTARSDHEGVFVFADLPAGRYVVYPGFLPGDGAFYFDQPANVPREVTADTETDAGDFQLLWELRAQWPGNGATVADTTRTFVWTPAPSVASYEISLDLAEPVKVQEPRFVRPGEDPLASGRHVWSVVGYDANGAFTAAFTSSAVFLVPEASVN